MSEWSYIGRTTVPLKEWPDIGTVVAAATQDSPRVSETVSGWLEDGLTVERVPTAWVRKFLCTTEPYRPETPE
jgi:hypothetical protein